MALGLELRHTHVCPTVGLSVVSGYPALVMQLCEGGTAFDRFIIAKPNTGSPAGSPAGSPTGSPGGSPTGSRAGSARDSTSRFAPLSDADAVRVSTESALGLAYLHEQGVHHRDIKPENVLLDGQLRAKICDFTLSTRASVEASGNTAQCGSMRYLAPEVVFGKFSAKADVYSYGMLIYAVLHRKVPFDTYPPMAVPFLVTANQQRPTIHLPPALEPLGAVIAACWDGDVKMRPKMASVVAMMSGQGQGGGSGSSGSSSSSSSSSASEDAA